MKITSALFAVVGLVSAAIDFGNWHPPVSGEVRSPCPALNSLANHGIINHDGKDLEVPALVKAMGEALST